MFVVGLFDHKRKRKDKNSKSKETRMENKEQQRIEATRAALKTQREGFQNLSALASIKPEHREEFLVLLEMYYSWLEQNIYAVVAVNQRVKEARAADSAASERTVMQALQMIELREQAFDSNADQFLAHICVVEEYRTTATSYGSVMMSGGGMTAAGGIVAATLGAALLPAIAIAAVGFAAAGGGYYYQDDKSVGEQLQLIANSFKVKRKAMYDALMLVEIIRDTQRLIDESLIDLLTQTDAFLRAATE
jgi:hypothetical protein